MRLGSRLLSAAALLWTIFTLVTSVVISIKILGDREFPLGLGLIHTRGWAGLWVTVPSALLAVAGLILLWARRTTGAKLLVAYSALWGFSLFVGLAQALPAIIRHPLAFCSSGTCATLPVAMTLTAAFVVSAAWYWRCIFNPPTH
jgi:hypothetical protein